MGKFILGKKLGMTTIFDANNEAQNVTLVECYSKISLIRDMEKDGYSGVQLEISKSKNKLVKREFRLNVDKEMNVGDELGVEIFELGDKVNVSGKGKSKGFQGAVKRHGFGGGRATHGNKHALRDPGSIGSGYPEHVVKGKRMAGRMGGKRVTSKSVKVVFLDKNKSLMGLKGAVPGVSGSVVEIYTVK